MFRLGLRPPRQFPGRTFYCLTQWMWGFTRLPMANLLPTGNYTTVTAPDINSFNAQVAAIQPPSPARWTAISPLKFIGGIYRQTFKKTYYSQFFQNPQLWFTGQPSYINSGKYPP